MTYSCGFPEVLFILARSNATFTDGNKRNKEIQQLPEKPHSVQLKQSGVKVKQFPSDENVEI